MRIPYIYIVIVLLSMLSACKTTQPAPTVEYRDRIEYKDRLVRDTVYTLDSVIVREDAEEKVIERYKYIYKEHIHIDTAYISQIDSISYPVYVEKDLTRWQRLKLDIGGYTLIALVLLLLLTLYKLTK